VSCGRHIQLAPDLADIGGMATARHYVQLGAIVVALIAAAAACAHVWH